MTTLEEGKYYHFKISDTLTMSDGEEFYKITDPNGIKHLLQKKPYENYNLQKGKTVSCRIDKINCSGKIFIEPRHPVYRLNGIYEFDIISTPEKKKNDAETVIVKDVFDNTIEIPREDIPAGSTTGNKIACKVVRIKKGKPVIAPAGSEPDYSGFTTGEKYRFRVVGSKKYSGKYTFHILEDDKGQQYPLRKKFYEGYDINKGDEIVCLFRKTGNESFLEPEHPYYQIGKTYTFDIIGENIIRTYPEGTEDALVLRNDFGKYILYPRNKANLQSIESGSIDCVVKDIIKGSLLLNCD